MRSLPPLSAMTAGFALAVSALFGPPAAALATAAESAPPPGLGIRLLEASASRADDPRAQTAIVDHVRPGTRFERDLEVSNGDAAPVEVQVYPVAAALVAGAFTADPGRDRNELADWLTVTPATLTLAAGERSVVTVAVDVPRDAAEGERYAAVLAERPAADAGQVGVASRVGIRVYLSVGPGGEPVTDFAVDELTAARTADGRPEVLAKATNTGGRAVDLAGELSLAGGPGGLAAGPFPADTGTTLSPGATAEVRILLDSALPAGPWRVDLVLRSGQLQRAVQGTLTFPAEGAADPVPVTAAGPDRTGLIVLALALLLSVIALLLTARQRRDDQSDGVG